MSTLAATTNCVYYATITFPPRPLDAEALGDARADKVDAITLESGKRRNKASIAATPAAEPPVPPKGILQDGGIANIPAPPTGQVKFDFLKPSFTAGAAEDDAASGTPKVVFGASVATMPGSSGGGGVGASAAAKPPRRKFVRAKRPPPAKPPSSST